VECADMSALWADETCLAQGEKRCQAIAVQSGFVVG